MDSTPPMLQLAPCYLRKAAAKEATLRSRPLPATYLCAPSARSDLQVALTIYPPTRSATGNRLETVSECPKRLPIFAR